MPKNDSPQGHIHAGPVAGGTALQIVLKDVSLDFEASKLVKERLADLVREFLVEGHRSFLLDVSAAQSIDSCGVGILIAAHHQISEAGGRLAVVGAGAFVTKVLKMMSLDRFLLLAADQDEALAAVVEDARD